MVIFNGDQILLVRLTYYPSTWTFPGGAIDKKETAVEAVIRECREEVGIVLNNPEYLADLYFEHEYKKDTVSVFKASVTNPLVTIDGREVAEANWYDLNNLPPMGKNAKAMLNLL